MSNKPLVTIIIATFNSMKTLPMVLDALQKQSLPREKMEILLLDGGSSDETPALGKKYGCQLIPNPRTEPVYAKFLGYLKAQGKYIVYLDHDEVIENSHSLENKIAFFTQFPDVHAVIGSGYRNPAGFSITNQYINEFGDPFSYFIYRLSKSVDYFVTHMSARYPIKNEDKTGVVFDFSQVEALPIIELCAAGSMIDAEFFKTNFPATQTDPALIPHFFYLLLSKAPTIALTKNDGLLHYSSETIGRYLNKIRWRIKNNIYHVDQMGQSGFTGRDKFQPSWLQYKKYLYLPYTLSLILPLLDTLWLCVTRRDWQYLIHWPLSLFTAGQIVYHYLRKSLGYHPDLRSYDESKVVTKV
ncbi:MAG TPA: glycosyltransferase family A protein [Vitreimonas sp.]|nr:glycosyltransferase family A protein [Vitreimonas sp.]